MATKSAQDIENLKAVWMKDPSWDIEDTEGFEAHRELLKHYHEQMDAEWRANFEAKEAKMRIKTIRTEVFLYGTDQDTSRDDMKISDLVREGWTVSSVSFVTFIEDSGDRPSQEIDRLVTLTR